MKKLLWIFMLSVLSLAALSQSNVDFRGDSARFYKNGGYMEVVIRNKTKDSLGFLYNIGNGVTEFRKISGLSGSGIPYRLAIFGYNGAITSSPNFRYDSTAGALVIDTPKTYTGITGVWDQGEYMKVAASHSLVSVDLGITGTTIFSQPWMSSGTVYRSKYWNSTLQNGPIKNSSSSLFGDSTLGAATFHAAWAGVSGRKYASAFEWWQTDTAGTLQLSLQMYSAGTHIAGFFKYNTVLIGAALNIGYSRNSAQFDNMTGVFNVDANSEGFNFLNFPTQSYTRGTDFMLNLTSAGLLEKFNPRTADVFFQTLFAGDKIPTYNHLSGLYPQLFAHGPTASLELSSDGTNAYNIDNEISFARQGAGKVLGSVYPSDSSVFAMKSSDLGSTGTEIDAYIATANSDVGGLQGQNVFSLFPQGTVQGFAVYRPTFQVNYRLAVGGLASVTENSYFEVNATSLPVYWKNLPVVTFDSTNNKPLVLNPSTGAINRMAWPSTGAGSLSLTSHLIPYGNASNLYYYSTRLKYDSLDNFKDRLTFGLGFFYQDAPNSNIIISTNGNNAAPALSEFTAIGASTPSFSLALGADHSTFVGAAAGSHITTPPNNTYIGAEAGATEVLGWDNTALGYQAASIAGLTERYNNSIFLGRKTGRKTNGNLANTLLLGDSLRSDLSNIAILGRETQGVLLGNGGGNTAARPTANQSAIYYNTDSLNYEINDGTNWYEVKRIYVAPVTLVAGTKTFAVPGSTSNSKGFFGLSAPSSAASTVEYQVSCTTGTCTVQANLAATTINTADVSSGNVQIIIK